MKSLIVDCDRSLIPATNSDTGSTFHVYSRYIVDNNLQSNKLILKSNNKKYEIELLDDVIFRLINVIQGNHKYLNCIHYMYYIINNIPYEGVICGMTGGEVTDKIDTLCAGDIVFFTYINNNDPLYHVAMFIGYHNNEAIYIGKLGRGDVCIIDKENTDKYLGGISKIELVSTMQCL